MRIEKEYFAFISYKREDEKWAKWLQHKLEHYKLPSNLNGRTDLPKEIRPIFKDTSELMPGNLPEQIREALELSKNLIIICSPRSAESEWVNKEIETFIAMGRTENIIPFIIEGSPFAKDPKEECFPLSLRALPKEQEILGTNINELGRNAAVVKVIARMFDIRFDILWQRFERELRRRRRLIIWGISLLAVLAIVIATWMFYTNNELRKIQARAVVQEAEKLVEEGDTYTARLLLLELLNSNSYDSILDSNFEAVLRKADQHNTAILRRDASAKTCAIFSMNDKYIVSGGDDGKVIIWDAQTGSIEKSIREEDLDFDPINSVACSNDSRYIVAAKRNAIKVWNIETGKEMLSIKDGEDIYTYASFSPDGSLIASATQDGTIKLWNSITGEKTFSLKCHNRDIRNVIFSSDGQYIISASDDEIVEVWNIQTRVCKCKLKGYYVCCSPDGRHMATLSKQGGITIWDYAGKEKKQLKGHTSWINTVKFSSNGKFLVSASNDNTVCVWDIQKGEIVHTMNGHKGYVYDASFSMDGKRIVSASDDHTIRIWSLPNGNEMKSIDGTNPCISLDFSPDGKHFATGIDDGTIEIWNHINNQKEITLKKHKGMVRSVSFSPDGKYIVSTSDDGTVKVWNVDDGYLLMTLEGHNGVTTSAHFSPDGLYIASSSWDGTIIIWSSNSGKIVQTLKGHNGEVSSVAFSSDGKHILSASYDRTIKIWDISLGKEVYTLQGHKGPIRSAIYSPDGLNIISVSFDYCIKWWFIKNHINYLTLDNHNSAIYSVCFCPEGNYYLTASHDNTVRIWNYDREIQTLSGHLGPVTSAVFCKEGSHIISASIDKKIIIWEFPSFERLINRTKERFKNRQLTFEERNKYYLE